MCPAGKGALKMRFFLVRWLLLWSFLPVFVQAQAIPGPTVRRDLHHDISAPLAELIRTSHPVTHGKLEAEPARRIPRPEGLMPMSEDPVRQLSTTGYSPQIGLNFEGIGDGQYGFTVEYIPADPNGAVGATQYVQWVNTYFAVFDKATGTLLAGPAAGNTLWSGFGSGCEFNNDGDPIVLYDKLANRWVMSQFSVTTGPFLQCIAISTTSDATGPWLRYSFQYNYLDDYPKMGVWPDAYYETFNMFNGSSFVGSDVCAYNRTAMLAGLSATQICFQQNSSVGGLLPADLDGTTLPPSGSPNYLLNFGVNSLNLYKFHVDFNHPSNSTFTGPTVISVAPFTPLCNGGDECVPQPLAPNKLDSLADRLMYRLAYRKFADHESLVVNHTVAVSGSGGIRWYEIQSPNSGPRVAQQGTYAPDANYRWMGSIAMDHMGDIALGYSVASASMYPSIAFAGRAPTDPPGTLQSETLAMLGSGSQTPHVTRWGDYSSMTVDPIDDCTFWYTQQYQLTTGAYNWNTRIVSFQFPACQSGTYVSLYPSSMTYGPQVVGSASPAQQVQLSNHHAVRLTIASISVSGDFQQNNNCGTSLAPNSSCTINVSFHPTATGARTGTLSVTDNGPGSPQTVLLTGLGSQLTQCVFGALSNAGFESGALDCWTGGGSPMPAVSTAQAHGGSFSALLGSTGAPEPTGNSWISQLVTIPADVQNPTLSFWYWPGTDDSLMDDWQEAQIRDSNSNPLAQIFKSASDAESWRFVTFDLTPYKGRTIQLYFNVHEDGYGDPTYMYLDDLAITSGATPQRFVPVAPCRVADTRTPPGVFGGPAISGGTSRDFPITQGGCGIPATATAYAFNVTVVPHGLLNYLTIWPTGAPQPDVSTLNSYDARIKANAAIVGAGTGRAVSVYVTDTTDVILDITGYFTTTDNSALAFFPLPPCRIADTRSPAGPLGGPMLRNGQARDFPVLQSACGIPGTAEAYSLNLAAVPRNGRSLLYMTAWPTGQPQPSASTLNAPTGTVVANAAIIPAGDGGGVTVSPFGNDTDLVIDINGYFAPANSAPNPMSLYTVTPCRVLDTRLAPPRRPFSGEFTVDVGDSPCGIDSSATAYVLNAGVVPSAPLWFLTLWPDDQPLPQASTLNAIDRAVSSNMAIVSTDDGSIDAYASATTHLILDISAYFAP